MRTLCTRKVVDQCFCALVIQCAVQNRIVGLIAVCPDFQLIAQRKRAFADGFKTIVQKQKFEVFASTERVFGNYC